MADAPAGVLGGASINTEIGDAAETVGSVVSKMLQQLKADAAKLDAGANNGVGGPSLGTGSGGGIGDAPQPIQTGTGSTDSASNSMVTAKDVAIFSAEAASVTALTTSLMKFPEQAGSTFNKAAELRANG